MNKWIAEFELEDGDTMPEHMDLEYKGAKIDFHCKPMWIPVTERLPEKSGLYLVTAPYDKFMPVSSRYFNKRGEQSFWSGHPMDEVVAWMPLPEPYPYKGEQE